jgi:hypothetical protein
MMLRHKIDRRNNVVYRVTALFTAYCKRVQTKENALRISYNTNKGDENTYKIVLENPESKRKLSKLIGEKTVISKLVLKLQAVRVRTGFIRVISALL